MVWLRSVAAGRVNRGEDPLPRPLHTSKPDDDDRLITAAILYYQADRSQDDIARHLGVSRPTVSRLLARARQIGVVRIEIVPLRVDLALAEHLRERLTLRSVHVAPGHADPDDPAPVLAGRVDDALDAAGLQAGDVVVVSWGRAVHSLGRYRLKPRTGVVVAPAMGGSTEDRPWFQANEIARHWAAALGGTPRYLHAPAYVSPALKRSLLREEGVRSTLDLWEVASAAVVGVGAWPKGDASLVAAGSPPISVITDAVGDAAARFFAEDGTLVHYPEESRLLAVTAERLRRIPHVVGVAAGVDKVRAIVGAAQARLVSSLVLDAVTARAVAAHLDGRT